jgi:hypothetical protein
MMRNEESTIRQRARLHSSSLKRTQDKAFHYPRKSCVALFENVNYQKLIATAWNLRCSYGGTATRS